jgi:hypothetical protein
MYTEKMYGVTVYRFVITIICYLIIQQTYFNVNGENQSKLFHDNLDKQLVTNCIQSNINGDIYDYSSYDIEDDKKENLISFSKYKGKNICCFQGF